jgi:hypothetical protein
VGGDSSPQLYSFVGVDAILSASFSDWRAFLRTTAYLILLVPFDSAQAKLSVGVLNALAAGLGTPQLAAQIAFQDAGTLEFDDAPILWYNTPA